MTTLSLILISAGVGVLIGMLITWLACREQIEDLKFDKDIAEDFNEKLIRDRDEIEQRYQLAVTAYCAHLDHHVCEWKEVEEEWPDEVSFQ